MNVLSLFDGISCCHLALDKLGIKIDNYYTSEIDKYAEAVSRYNYPDAIRLGDVTNWQSWDIDWSSIDLVAGGSPCQGFSFAGKQLAFDDPRSRLFFEMVLIIKKVLSHNPNAYFLLENVKMKKEFEKVITSFLGVEPILINSALVSAQNRQRLYWFGKGSAIKLLDFKIEEHDAEEVRRIQGSSPREGEEQVLGETQKRYSNMQNMWKYLQENRPKGDYENLLSSLLCRKQKTNRQKEESDQEIFRLSFELSKEECGKTSRISKGLQKNGSSKESNEKTGSETREENCKINESTCEEANIWNLKRSNHIIRYIEDFENENGVQDLSHPEGFMYRPCDSVIEGWSEQLRESTNSLQGMQFIQKRQDNGRVYGVFEIQIQSIKGITQPEDRGLLLRDIIEDGEVDGEKSYCIDANYFKGGNLKNYFEKSRRQLVFGGAMRGRYLDESGKRLDTTVGSQAGLTKQRIEIRQDGKSNCLSTVQKDSLCIQIGEADIKGHDSLKRVYNPDGKSPTLTTMQGGHQEPKISQDLITWRKLTPLECERLQLIPEQFTSKGIINGKEVNMSNSARYKMLGNGWTVDVIAHILSFVRF